MDNFESVCNEIVGPKYDVITEHICNQIRQYEGFELTGNNNLYRRLTDADFSAIVKALIENEIALRSISLKHHRITNAGLQSVLQYGLADNNSLELLDFEGNDIGGVNCGNLLSSYLRNEYCKLQSLNLSNNPLGEQCGMVLGDALRVRELRLSLSVSHSL